MGVCRQLSFTVCWLERLRAELGRPLRVTFECAVMSCLFGVACPRERGEAGRGDGEEGVV